MKRLRIRFPKHHRRVLVGLIIAFLVFSISFWRVTKSPQFCLVCHYMRPYYDAWKTSSHNNVPCVKCHYAPGLKAQLEGEVAGLSQIVKYVTRTYSNKPKAEISDASCLRSGCHEERLLKGKVTFKKGIIFDHAHHLSGPVRGMKLRCTTCHSHIVQGKHMTVTETTCFMCHFKGHEKGQMVGTCLTCHGPPTKKVEYAGVSFDHSAYVTKNTDCMSCHPTVTQGTGEVPPERCYSCHVERDPKTFDPAFLHKKHVTDHKVECFECHVSIQHGKLKEGLTPLLTLKCLDCHANQHSVAEQMYSGVGVDDLPNTPSPMFLAKVNCNGCHKDRIILHAGKTAFKTGGASGKACIACHGEGYDEMLTTWQDMTKEMLTETNAEADKVGALVKSAGNSEAQKHYDTAVKAIRFVESDGSMGAHNIEYANSVIEHAQTELESAKKALDTGKPDGGKS